MLSHQELFRIGLGLMKQKLHQQAADIAAEALNEFSDNGDLWELLGVARHHLAQHDLAVAALETATLLKPLDPGARFCLAGSYVATGKEDLAVFMYDLVGNDAATPTWLLPQVASRLGQLKEYELALQVCRQLIAREPGKHEAHFGVAFYLRRTGATLETIAGAVQQAHELCPASRVYRVVLAALWQELGRTDDAYDLLRDLTIDAVGCACSLRRMLAIFHAAGDHERSAACARRMRLLESDLSTEPGVEP